MESKWTPVKDEQGRTYYWNESTHETSWQPPLDVVLPTDQDDFKHDVEELFCTLDKNGDGVLSFEEFSAWVADVTSVKPDAATAYFDFADSGKHETHIWNNPMEHVPCAHCTSRSSNYFRVRGMHVWTRCIIRQLRKCRESSVHTLFRARALARSRSLFRSLALVRARSLSCVVCVCVCVCVCSRGHSLPTHNACTRRRQIDFNQRICGLLRALSWAHPGSRAPPDCSRRSVPYFWGRQR